MTQISSEPSAKQQKAQRLAETTIMSFRQASYYVDLLEELQWRADCTDEVLEQMNQACIQCAALAGDSPVIFVGAMIELYPERKK